jgi:hypothetical protein
MQVGGLAGTELAAQGETARVTLLEPAMAG